MPKLPKKDELDHSPKITIKVPKKSPKWNFIFVILFTASLMLLNLSCFAVTYSYPFFGDNHIHSEIFIIFIYFIIFSSLFTGILFPIGWLASKQILKIIPCIALYFSMLSIMELNLTLSLGEVLAYYLSGIFGDALADFMRSYTSNMIALFLSFCLWWLLSNLKTFVIEFCTMSFFGLSIFLIYQTRDIKRVDVQENRQVYPEYLSKVPSRNLIYLIFNEHASHSYLLENMRKQKQKDEQLSFVDGFYNKFGFNFYPHVYSISNSNIFSVVSAVNFDPYGLKANENESYLKYLNDLSYQSYLKKGDDNKPRYSLAENELFETMYKNHYKINVYQTKYFDFCQGIGKDIVSKCKTFGTFPSMLYDEDVNANLKALTLMGHWFFSHKSAEKWAGRIEGFISFWGIPTRKIAFLGMPLNESYPVGQFKMLDELEEDIINANGKNVFFAYIMQPSHPYMYDEYCRIKPKTYSWKTIYKDQNDFDEKNKLLQDYQRRESFDEYLKQLKCLYGQLDGFFSDLKANGILEKSIVVMHGDTGPKINRDNYDYKDNLASFFAVYKPNDGYLVNSKGCDLATLTGSFFLKLQNMECANNIVSADFQEWCAEYPFDYDFYNNQASYDAFINKFKQVNPN